MPNTFTTTEGSVIDVQEFEMICTTTNLTALESWDGITEYSIHEILDMHWPGGYAERPSYEEQCVVFRAFCEENNIHYYARPREDFFAYEGWEEARKAECTGLVMEDLS